MSLYTPLLEPEVPENLYPSELAEKHSEEISTELHHATKRTAHRALVRAIAKLFLAEEARYGQGLGQRVCER